MNKSEVVKLIKSSERIKEFIDGSEGSIECLVDGIPIRIFKEGVGCGHYYVLPYSKNYNYQNAVEFMQFAIPEVSRMIEKRRDEKLTQPDF